MPADYGSINTEPGAFDMINRYGLETASAAQTLLNERRRDYNGVDMDYKTEEAGVANEQTNSANGCIRADQGQDA